MLQANIIRVTRKYKAGEGVLSYIFTIDKLMSGSSQGKYFLRRTKTLNSKAFYFK